MKRRRAAEEKQYEVSFSIIVFKQIIFLKMEDISFEDNFKLD